MKRRRRPGPEFENFLKPDVGAVEASVAGRIVGALKPGAFLAIAVAMTFIYLDTFGGMRLDQRLTALAVGAAFFGPAILAAVRALRARRQKPPQV